MDVNGFSWEAKESAGESNKKRGDREERETIEID